MNPRKPDEEGKKERSGRLDAATIAAEMIRAASKDVSKTAMMYAARLNYRHLRRHLAELVREGLVTSHLDEGTYASTAKGRAFLNAFDEVETISEALEEKQRAMMSLFRSEVEPDVLDLPEGRALSLGYSTQPALAVKRRHPQILDAEKILEESTRAVGGLRGIRYPLACESEPFP